MADIYGTCADLHSDTYHSLVKFHLRYVRIFYALRPTPRQICEYYGAKNPSKIMDLRPDALGMLMTRANVHPGCRVLVVESACGLVAGTVLARLNGRRLQFVFAPESCIIGHNSTSMFTPPHHPGRGALVHFHEHLDPSVDVLSHMNLTDSQLASYHALPLANLHAMPSHEEYLTKLKATKLQARKVAITKRQEGLRAAKELMQLESFDAYAVKWCYRMHESVDRASFHFTASLSRAASPHSPWSTLSSPISTTPALLSSTTPNSAPSSNATRLSARAKP